MAVKFKVLPRKNPQDINAPEKFYTAVSGNGEALTVWDFKMTVVICISHAGEIIKRSR